MKTPKLAKIESGIPIPPARNHYKMADWETMKVGDSFFTQRSTGHAYQASRSFGIRQSPPWKFIVRVAEQNGVKGCRVWRQS